MLFLKTPGATDWIPKMRNRQKENEELRNCSFWSRGFIFFSLSWYVCVYTRRELESFNMAVIFSWNLLEERKKKKKLKKQKKNRAPQVVALSLVSDPLFFRNIAPGDLHSSCYLSGKILSRGESWRAPPSWLHLGEHMVMNSFFVWIRYGISLVKNTEGMKHKRKWRVCTGVQQLSFRVEETFGL